MRRRILLLSPVILLLFVGYVFLFGRVHRPENTRWLGPAARQHETVPGYRMGDEFQFSTSSKQLLVTLVTPRGERITEATAEQAGVYWRNEDVEPPIGKVDGGQQGAASFHEPHESGVYVVEIAHRIPGEGGVVSVRFKRSSLDLGAAGYLLAMGAYHLLSALPSSELRAQSYDSPARVYLGEPFEYVAALVGPEVREPVQLQVQMEYRSVQTVNGQEELGEPLVETERAVIVRDAQGRYTAHLTPTRIGRLRVGGIFSGELVKGGKFRVEVFHSHGAYVDPVAVRYLGWTEKAVDVNQDGIFDRWDVSADLDVVEPGPYSLHGTLMYRGSGWGGLGFFGSQELRAGKQTLTASLDRIEIQPLMIDGEWEIQALGVDRGFERNPERPATQVVRGAKTRAYRVAEWGESRQR